MHILITSDWYAPVVNGVVTSVLNLKRGLEEAGHDVRVLTLSSTIHSHRDDEVYYMDSASVGFVYPNARVSVTPNSELLNELITWKPDVIHSQCELSTFVMATRIAKHTGAPIVHTYHTMYEDYTQYFCPSELVGRKLVKEFSLMIADYCAAFIVPSGKVKAVLEGYGMTIPIHVIPTGLDLTRYLKPQDAERARIRERYGVTDDECLFGYIGRLAKEKHIEEILEFMADPAGACARLMIVGGGPYQEHLQEKAHDLGVLSRIIFTGMVEPEHVSAYYHAVDVFVSASTSETQGLTYMEAMASGLPLLCHQDESLAGIIIPGENGYTYSSPEEFFAIARQLREDPMLRRQIGQEAKATTEERFSLSAFASSCEEVYRAAIANKRMDVLPQPE